MLRPPVVALVGAEYEENLSLRYLAAAVETAGLYQRSSSSTTGPAASPSIPSPSR
jgi:hypothetical protein